MNTIFIVKRTNINKRNFDKYDTEIVNVFFNKKDTLLYLKNEITKGTPIDPYKKDHKFWEFTSDSVLLWLEYEKTFATYCVFLKHKPIPNIMKSWCDYTTLVKINAYTYPDYYHYFKGNLEKITGIEF